MKPSDIYAMPPDLEETLYWVNEDIVTDVFNLDSIRELELNEYEKDNSPLTFVRKSQLMIDSNNWVSLHSAVYEGVPFAAICHNGNDHSGNDNDVVITDKATYDLAKAYVLSKLMKPLLDEDVVDPDKDLDWNMSGAVLGNFPDGTRLARRLHVGFHTGTPVFDEEALKQAFETQLRPLAADPDYEKGLHSKKGAAAALDIIWKSTMAQDRIEIGEWSGEKAWVAGFFLGDNEVYSSRIAGYDLQQRTFHWSRNVKIDRVCSPSMWDAMKRYVDDRSIDYKDPGIIDFKESFGLTDEEVDLSMFLVTQGIGDDFLSAAVERIKDRTDVPEDFRMHSAFIHARLLSEDPSLVRFGLADMAGVRYAKEYWEKVKDKFAKEQAQQFSTDHM